MKYLKLHYAFLWFCVLLYTIIDCIFWLAEYIWDFLWTFKYIPMSKSWKDEHCSTDRFYTGYIDNNIIESFTRRWGYVKSGLKQI